MIDGRELCECGDYYAPCPWGSVEDCDTAASYGIFAGGVLPTGEQP